MTRSRHSSARCSLRDRRLAACGGSGGAEPTAEPQAAVARHHRAGEIAGRAGHARSHRQLRGRRILRRRPGSSGRVVATPVDVGQFVQAGRRARPPAGYRRRTAARRGAGRGDPRRSQPEARRVAERAGADDRAALRVAARHGRRLEHGRRSGAHRRQKPRSRTSTPRVPRWRRPGRSSRWRRRRSPTSPSSRRSPATSASAACRSASTSSRRPPSSRCSRSTRCGCS